VLRLAGLAGGLGVAGAAGLITGAASPAGADTGAPVLIGETNTGPLTTYLELGESSAGSAALEVVASGTGMNPGLTAVSGSAGDVKCGGTGRLSQIPGLTGTAAPTWGPNVSGENTYHELVRTDTGIVWASRGGLDDLDNRWKRLNAVRVDTASGTGGVFVPVRLLDTRTGGTPYAAGSTHTLKVAGAGSGASAIPADAIAVFGNLTAVAPSGNGGFPDPGFLTLFPTGAPRPVTSSVNVGANREHAYPNFFFCALGSGMLSIYTSPETHVLVDISAYVQ
jgi:hypothetical protein